MTRTSTSSGGEIFEITIDRSFETFLIDAATRIGYVETGFTLAVEGSSVRVTTDGTVDRDAIIRRVNHALYREKIRAESAPLRSRFLSLLATR